MTRLLPAFGLALLIGSGSALASTHSDYTKSFPLQSLKTYAFKDQRRISRDPLAQQRWGWPRNYDVWAVPYTQSTVIVDIIDAHTNQLVWRGHAEDTLNMDHPDRTLSKAVDNVIDRFSHDTKHSGPA